MDGDENQRTGPSLTAPSSQGINQVTGAQLSPDSRLYMMHIVPIPSLPLRLRHSQSPPLGSNQPVKSTLHASIHLTQLDIRNHLHALHRQTTHLSNSISNRQDTLTSTSSRYITTFCAFLIVNLATAETESGQYERTEE
jgi:hypothetical protein